jgi:hypothetical protein
MRAVIRTLCLGVAALAPGAAAAHEAVAGWSYDGWCCGGRDCQEIAQEQVKVTADGYLVSVPAGSHVTALQSHEKLFRYEDVRRSGDQRFHACIIPHTQEFRCLYVPDFTY